MSKHLPKGLSMKQTALLRRADPGVVDIAPPAPLSGAFFSFRYASTEISLQGGKTRVKARQARLENGKLSTEAFDAELGAAAYDELVHQAQRQMLDQKAWLLRSIAALLPTTARGSRPDRE